MKKLCTALAVLSLTTVLSSPQASHAAGFYIQEQSTSGLGASFAGEAVMARDASTVYFNPSAMVLLDGPQMNAGAHIIAPMADVTNLGSTFNGAAQTAGESSPYDPEAVPNFHIATPINGNKDLWFGFSVTAPFGLSNKYEANWFGRFDSIASDLKTLNFQPSLAYRVNDKFSVGGGLDIQRAGAQLSQAVDTPLGEGIGYFEGDDESLGFNLGATWLPSDKTRVGVHYRSGVKHDLELNSNVTSNSGTTVINDPRSKAELNLPQLATLAASHQVDDRLTVMGHVIWFGWESFDTLTAIGSTGTTLNSVTQNYENTFAVAIGAEYKYNDKLTLRTGFQFDETPVQEAFRTTRTPDGDRMWFSVGGTYEISPSLSLDTSATYIDVEEVDVNITRPQALTGTSSTINAEYDAGVAILAVGLNKKF